MTKKKKSPAKPPAPEPAKTRVEETPFEAVASICSVLVVGLFILTFIAQNYVIPSGSMENTLLVGDHLVVDRITLAPPAKWMPLVHYREPHRGDIVVFFKPVFQPGLDQTGWRRQAAIHYPREAPHRRARRPHSSAQWHRDSQRSGAAAALRSTHHADNYPGVSRRISFGAAHTRSQAAPPRPGPSIFPTTSSMAIWWFHPACTS